MNEEQKAANRARVAAWAKANPERHQARAKRWREAQGMASLSQRLVNRIDSAALATEVRQLLAVKFGKKDLFGVDF